jgi:proline iminopeptidase
MGDAKGYFIAPRPGGAAAIVGGMDLRAAMYSPSEPYDSGMLALDDVHTMYWECCGNPQGIPVFFLHGGPGGSCSPEHRRFFDPAVFRVVLFDQRGAGQSTPAGEAIDNTTAHLVRDIETLRDYLGIGRALIFGGSWGATLALAYGQAHPDRCLGFVLRGVFLGRPSEIEWFLLGLRQFFPEAWRDFAELLAPAERGDLSAEGLLRGYRRRLFDGDPRVHGPAALAWSRYECACSTLRPGAIASPPLQEALALARLEAHYFTHRCFLGPNQLLDNVYRIAGIPAAIVQGRYDMVCPAGSADALARAWPRARHVVIGDAGHSVWEPAIRAAVFGEVERFKRELS